MGIPIEELNRAGLVETGVELRKAKDANRLVHEHEAQTVAGTFGDTGENSLVQKLQNDPDAVDEGIGSGSGLVRHRQDSSGAKRVQAQKTIPDHETGVSTPDGGNDHRFRVSIKIRFSNWRRTDLSGKLDTILDCLVHARRRLLGDDTTSGGTGGTVRSRPGGRKHHSGAVVKGKVPF
jgi:hypothetical protein